MKQSVSFAVLLSPKSSLISVLIVLAFVYHLTEHVSSWFLGSVKYKIKIFCLNIMWQSTELHISQAESYQQFNSRLTAESCAFML